MHLLAFLNSGLAIGENGKGSRRFKHCGGNYQCTKSGVQNAIINAALVMPNFLNAA